MGKRVFVSADWKENESNPKSCDKNVVGRIREWADDDRRSIEIDCTDDVHSSVLDTLDDCRRCDIKRECGSHINWSSIVIFVVGDNTATKSAGACSCDECSPAYSGKEKLPCKLVWGTSSSDVRTWDGTLYKNEMGMSYLQYEITKAAQLGKSIIVVFNSMNKQESWIPSWYTTLLNDTSLTFTEKCRVPFWKDTERKGDCYQDIKEHLL
ncbi:MAG: TIR domain-containing protein [Oscillospiraceae bacterium]|jgi:hypothetical protein|nr:TIR domain-containing protein [Oscillospiraceae bacterium]